MTDEPGPYVDAKLPKRLVPYIRQTLRVALAPDEELFGLFSVFRFRRGITVLAVTDRRLLTLGEEHAGLPIIDDLVRSDVSEVRVERERAFRTGQVTAHLPEGEVPLGTLNYTPTTFARLEEVLDRVPDRAMPTIPLPGADSPPAPEAIDGEPLTSAAGQASSHPLVVHLTALADLHERGALTDEEFVAAKARLLADPGGS